MSEDPFSLRPLLELVGGYLIATIMIIIPFIVLL
mgnify:CR=1 FL=1|tara:strand:- start:225 stop:326 length:102 start_codon:yes stop_codon:yes gene_type:complete